VAPEGATNLNPALLLHDSIGGGGSKASSSSGACSVRGEGLDVFGGVMGDSSRCGALPEQQLVSQGESSLQRNLEVQEMTLKVQMELQEELSRQLQLQKKLQGEMETLINTHVEVRDESIATNSKMGAILALKRKLRHELQAHLRMQHKLLSQLNQVVLPAVERLHTSGDRDQCSAGNEVTGGVGSSTKVKCEELLSEALAPETERGDDDDDEDEEKNDSGEDLYHDVMSPTKRQRP